MMNLSLAHCNATKHETLCSLTVPGILENHINGLAKSQNTHHYNFTNPSFYIHTKFWSYMYNPFPPAKIFQVQCILGYPNLDYRILDYPNEPNGRLRHACATYLLLWEWPFFALCSLPGDCGPIAAVSFTEAKTKSKRKRKALSIIKDKVSIVKQLKSSSVAIIAEPYGL